MLASHPSALESLLVSYARRFPIRRGKLRVVDSLWRAAAGDRSTRRLADLRHGGLKMPCDLTEMLQRQFYFFGTYFLEEHILECWESAAKGAKVILDVGANAGIYSLAALAVQRDATVHAFEPTPEIAARLRETAKLNGLDRLHVHQMAVSSENGHATLRRFRGELETNEGMNFIRTDLNEPDAERVQTVSLDRFCEDHAISHVDLLKLDIQGYEHKALTGARQLVMAGHIGTIFMELNWAKGAEVPCAATESIRLLEEAGCRFSKPGRRLDWQKPGDWLRTMSDVVARRT
jgi:FkbM family methyltransferase